MRMEGEPLLLIEILLIFGQPISSALCTLRMTPAIIDNVDDVMLGFDITE